MLGGVDFRGIAAAVLRALGGTGVTLGALTVNGNTTIGGNATVTGNLASAGTLTLSGVLSPAQITGNQNDYAPAGIANAQTLRINSDARRNITGIVGGASGRVLVLHNVGVFPIVIKMEDAASTAANRFSFGHTLSGGHSMRIEYDGTTARWRCTFREEPAGTLKDFAGGTVPEGYLACNGAAVSRTGTTQALFNEIGTTWGVGDGATTFNIPNFARRAVVGSGGVGTATLGNAVGNTGGEETHQLTLAELPSFDVPVFSADTDRGIGNVSEFSIDNHTTIGSNTPHNVIQPSAVVTKIIKF